MATDELPSGSAADEDVKLTDESVTPASSDETPVNESVTAQQTIRNRSVKSVTKQTTGKLKQLLRTYWLKKKFTVPLTVIAVILLLAALPLTRYDIAGLFFTAKVSVTVVDSKTGTPVSSAQVRLAGRTVTTNGSGKSTLTMKLGSSSLHVTKQYYTSAAQGVMITFSTSHNNFKVELSATGRQVPITVVNYISGKPIPNVLIKVLNTEAKTDKSGAAIVVLPTAASSQKATLSLSNFTDHQVTIQVTDKKVVANNFSLTPSGKLYFLSNQSGKIDVVKTNLDGTDRQTVLAGTGSEEPYSTSLLASRDWKYLALLAKRGGNNASVYLIDTSTDKLTTMDEGNANFSLVGWSNDTFVYQVSRTNVQNWQPNAQALKSYNAVSGKLTTLDQTTGEGTGQYDYGYTSFSSAYLIGQQVVYAKNWYGTAYYPNHLTGKSVDFDSVNSDGAGKQTIKSFPVSDSVTYGYSVDLSLYEPRSLYVRATDASGSGSYYVYEDGAIKTDATMTDAIYYNTNYLTYLESPSGNKTFWADQRDGKNTLFVGDQDGKNSKQVATLSDYTAYGWYTDDYLLVSKNSSELYIRAADGSGSFVKLTDYYKPPVNYRGYGGGYGGL